MNWPIQSISESEYVIFYPFRNDATTIVTYSDMAVFVQSLEYNIFTF